MNTSVNKADQDKHRSHVNFFMDASGFRKWEKLQVQFQYTVLWINYKPQLSCLKESKKFLRQAKKFKRSKGPLNAAL